VFFGIVLEVVPKLIAQGILGVDVFLEDIGQDGLNSTPCCALRRDRRELEGERVFESNNEYALTMLRNEALGVDDLCVHVVAEIAKGVHDHEERLAFVVAAQVLDVFEHKGLGLVVLDDVGQMEEQVALLLIVEAMLSA